MLCSANCLRFMPFTNLSSQVAQALAEQAQAMAGQARVLEARAEGLAAQAESPRHWCLGSHNLLLASEALARKSEEQASAACVVCGRPAITKGYCTECWPAVEKKQAKVLASIQQVVTKWSAEQAETQAGQAAQADAQAAQAANAPAEEAGSRALTVAHVGHSRR